ncbi:hypothetical protein EV360DRAFT_80689 [Lentinula raphanica]|nr:hypothetical protein EV360DRAFT_80689 [Lentinula raphanica]
MRSRIIHALYVAVTLLGAASVAASPLPVDSRRYGVALRLGLLDVKNKKPVAFDADLAERQNAQYLLCIGVKICSFYDHTAPASGSIGFTKPELLKPASTSRIVSRDQQYRKRVDADWYQDLEIALKKGYAEFSPEVFVKDLEKWSRVHAKNYNDGKSFIFGLLNHFDSTNAFVEWVKLEDKREHIESILDTVKADPMSEVFKNFMANRKSKQMLRQRIAEYTTKKKAEALQNTVTSPGGDSPRDGEPSGSISIHRNSPVTGDSYHANPYLAVSPFLSSSHEEHAAPFTSSVHQPDPVSIDKFSTNARVNPAIQNIISTPASVDPSINNLLDEKGK